jgi:hypothetical protein
MVNERKTRRFISTGWRGVIRAWPRALEGAMAAEGLILRFIRGRARARLLALARGEVRRGQVGGVGMGEPCI